MFRFARYFFFVFLITTVIPLLLMFVWTNHQMQRMEHEREHHLLDVGVKQLNNLTFQYLKMQESDILEKIQDLSQQNFSDSDFSRIFAPAKVEKAKAQKVESYYEVLNISGVPEIYGVSVVPFGKSAIKISHQVNLSKLRPNGPFDVELYLGAEISKKSFMASIHDPFMPKPPGMGHPFLDETPPPLVYENPRTFEYGKVPILGRNGETVATLLIKTGLHKKPMEFGKSFENIFGLIILLAGSVSSLLVGFYINRNFIKPLFIISEASKQVQNGNLSFRLDTNIKQRQILNTFTNFNRMIKGLREKDELRKNFITNLTHDLRTPLIAQERSLELISKEFEDLGMKDAYELAKGLEKNNNHLLRMVNLILESYRFDSETLNLEISLVNLSSLVDDCFEKLKPLSDQKNIVLLNRIPSDFIPVEGDITSFKRIFLNLISNDIENIEQNGTIKLDVELLGNFVKIYVEDDGPGISKEDINYIFDRYYTGKSDERKIGSGLGLDVCRKLVEMHSGEISVESEVNKYTRFIIKLPLKFQGNESK